MKWCVLDPGAVGQTAKAAAAATVDTYEAAACAALELHWLGARSGMYGPSGEVMRAWADLSRDTIAAEVSTARWLLDL
jgi:hypothetical protein